MPLFCYNISCIHLIFGKVCVSMYTITYKKRLNPTVTLIKIKAPRVAAKAAPGQFIILRVDADGERIPLTVSDCDSESGTVTVIYQTVGATTAKLDMKNAGDAICDFVGPLGRPTELEEIKKVAIIGGGVGCAIAYPIAKALFARGCEVHSILGFRSRELVILEDELSAVSSHLTLMTDDGSAGKRGLVTDALRTLIESGENYDRVIAIGPLPMMKFVSMLTKEYSIPTVVSMNPIMIDGTGMCGGCRLTVGGETKFACVDGPDFDGHAVDFDEVMKRASMYKDFERHAYEQSCNLFKNAE